MKTLFELKSTRAGEATGCWLSSFHTMNMKMIIAAQQRSNTPPPRLSAHVWEFFYLATPSGAKLRRAWSGRLLIDGLKRTPTAAPPTRATNCPLRCGGKKVGRRRSLTTWGLQLCLPESTDITHVYLALKAVGSGLGFQIRVLIQGKYFKLGVGFKLRVSNQGYGVTAGFQWRIFRKCLG